ncbi:MAG: hypothetical protein O3B73_17555, partial [bacterium]|nr:hypothetical protein [bacterium]
FQGALDDTWEVSGCPMSTMGMSSGKFGTWATWESRGQVFVSRIDALENLKPERPGEEGGKNKHPAFAQSDSGQGLLAWSMGSGWQKPGQLAYQFFDRSGHPVGESILGEPMAVWNRPAVYARPDGRLGIIY